jgi:hypothetical protein
MPREYSSSRQEDALRAAAAHWLRTIDTHSELASGVAGGFRPITFTFRGKALWLRGKASGKPSAAAPPRLPFAASRPHRKPPRRFDSEG